MSKTYMQWEENSAEVDWRIENDLGEITTGSISRDSNEVQSFLANGGEITTRTINPPIEQ
jgi:hypothetical protein